MAQVDLTSFFRYYEDEPHQQEAVKLLEAAMPASLLQDDSAWVMQYRNGPPEPEEPTIFSPGDPFSTQITKNFTYKEWTNGGQEARRFYNQGQCDICYEICQFLEQARAIYGVLIITSGHRPPGINQAVGGASNSEHLFKPGTGAVDCYPAYGEGMDFEQWVDRNWPFSVGYGMSYRGFTHVGIKADRGRYRWNY